MSEKPKFTESNPDNSTLESILKVDSTLNASDIKKMNKKFAAYDGRSLQGRVRKIREEIANQKEASYTGGDIENMISDRIDLPSKRARLDDESIEDESEEDEKPKACAVTVRNYPHLISKHYVKKQSRNHFTGSIPMPSGVKKLKSISWLSSRRMRLSYTYPEAMLNPAATLSRVYKKSMDKNSQADEQEKALKEKKKDINDIPEGEFLIDFDTDVERHGYNVDSAFVPNPNGGPACLVVSLDVAVLPDAYNVENRTDIDLG